jgi:molybdopterin-guanine dinucleotide biosynthesis protein A
VTARDAATPGAGPVRGPAEQDPAAYGPLGAIIAGGASTRYGAPKAHATVGGRRIVDRVAAALRTVAADLIVSANDPDMFADLGLPVYPDDRVDGGPLAGIETALRRARDAGRPGILAVAVDLPFPSVPLLERLRADAFADSAPDAVVPESPGRRGIEPLFAAYRTSCLPAIEATLEAGDRRMIGFHDRVTVRRIPLAEVTRLCDPERAFLNVNTPADRERAEALAATYGAASPQEPASKQGERPESGEAP